KETLERFVRHGAELIYFSPLNDKHLPPDIDALYLCGGYPELYADKLAKNTRMLEDIRNAVSSGVPTIAECGGFMLLHNAIDGHTMAGVINANAYRTEQLQRFGYTTLTAKRDNLLCAAGDDIRAHEFHYWDSDNPGGDFTAQKAGRDTRYDCAHATDTLYAGFPHVYVTDEMAKRFIKKAKK
ncbi:MAG: cobyrinic acid a,c-diamide synthase, partial [Oscillospiraceae bacterium]|nr:cobyrinic acid a,c-diamide synthase [Oscillospiraceae bacterium]